MNVILAFKCWQTELCNIVEQCCPLESILFVARQVVYVDLIVEDDSENDECVRSDIASVLGFQARPRLANHTSQLSINSLKHSVHELVIFFLAKLWLLDRNRVDLS